MATTGATFTDFEPYKLTGIKQIGGEPMRGSYATVTEVEYMGIRYAGKKVNKWAVSNDEQVHRFREECRILQRLRHPNIVKFMGIYFEEGERVPMLILEFLPLNLTCCIQKYYPLPDDVSFSILRDVAVGLHFLHSQDPPIIHRDLYSNNILLTSNMTAKISDLGMARILNRNEMNMQLARNPGHADFMPPEVTAANPKYGVGIDVFSYGIIMIHVLSGMWPVPQLPSVRVEDDKLVGVSEAERRAKFLTKIGMGHPLMGLITRCISNNPCKRAHANEIVEQMAEILLTVPISVHRVELLRKVQTDVRQPEWEAKEADKKDSSQFLQKTAHQGKHGVVYKSNY